MWTRISSFCWSAGFCPVGVSVIAPPPPPSRSTRISRELPDSMPSAETQPLEWQERSKPNPLGRIFLKGPPDRDFVQEVLDLVAGLIWSRILGSFRSLVQTSRFQRLLPLSIRSIFDRRVLFVRLCCLRTSHPGRTPITQRSGLDRAPPPSNLHVNSPVRCKSPLTTRGAILLPWTLVDRRKEVGPSP